jgi:uncharacterized membrane protein YqjE
MFAAQHDPSTVELIREIFTDLRTLVRQELALARAEIREEQRELLTALVLLSAAIAFLSAAGIWLLVAVTRGLAAVFEWPLWGVYAGVGLTLALIGGVVAAVAWHRLRTLRVLPKTRDSLSRQVHGSLDAAVHRPAR